MALSDELEALAKRHGALSYRNRADTQNPAFGFSAAGLASLLAEVRKQDDALILQLVEALCECAEDSQEQLNRMEAARLRDYKPNAIAWQEDTIAKAEAAITAGRARLEGKT